MKVQNKNIKSKNLFKESSTLINNKNKSIQKKNDLKPEIKEKESNENIKEKINLSKLYSLLENDFNKMSSSIKQLSTSITFITKGMKDKKTKFIKVLHILNDNLLKIMDSNNIKCSTDSQETIKKILDEMEKDNSSQKIKIIGKIE